MTIFSASTEFELPTADFDQLLESYQVIGKEVLDVGCRTGEFVNYLCNKGANATGFDLDSECIASAKKRYPECADLFSVSDILDYSSKSQRFDLILCIGVMSYVSEAYRDLCLCHMTNLLKEDGKLLVTFTKDSVLNWPIRCLSLFPCRFYGAILAPFITFLAYPFQKFLLSSTVSREHFHYKFSLGLYGLRMGAPKYLEKYRIDDINNSLITSKTAVYELPRSYLGVPGKYNKN